MDDYGVMDFIGMNWILDSKFLYNADNKTKYIQAKSMGDVLHEEWDLFLQGRMHAYKGVMPVRGEKVMIANPRDKMVPMRTAVMGINLITGEISWYKNRNTTGWNNEIVKNTIQGDRKKINIGDEVFMNPGKRLAKHKATGYLIIDIVIWYFENIWSPPE